MNIDSFSLFFYFSLCYVLYAIFITFVDDTTENAKPLSPSSFEKIAPNFSKVFHYFGSLLLSFFYFDFRVPLPLGQIGPICDRFWSHFRSNLLPMQLSFYRPGGVRAARFSKVNK